ncbi:MAG: serine/threonine-protein kinase [Lysobacterales bacterium]
MRTQFGHYQIVSELGRGGMGVVYKGYEGALNRYVAIKVLADSLAHDESIRERFLREARSMAALNDPHIIQIYFIGEDGGQTYFVMEFVEGESLGAMLKRENRLPVDPAAKIVYQTAQGLATAHDRGVVHRDIKPGNLMISTAGQVKIADFGIALSNQDLSKKLTSTGEFVGTPGYLSPEVCLGKPVDQRSDIFSLGIVLFEMLTGRMPFTDDSPLGQMLEVVKADIPDVRQLNGDVSPGVAAVLAKMIAKDPAARYQSCHELEADLAAREPAVRDGVIRLQPRVSTAAATLVGAKTPVSGQATVPRTPAPAAAPSFDRAQTRITPAGRSSPPPIPDPAPAAAGAPPAVAPATGSRGPLPWAVAAIALLALIGGAWAYQSGYLGGNRPTTVTIVSTAPAPTDSSTTATANPQAPSATGSPTPGAASTASTDYSGTAPASLPAAASTANDAPANPPAGSSVPPAAATATADAASTPAPTQAVTADPPREQIAKATPPKPAVPAKPRIPTVAVAIGGDTSIAGPAESAMASLLQSRGFRVIEGGVSGGESPNLRALARRADAVVYIHARPVGQQELTYYGQQSTLYTVQLGVKAYSTADGRLLWTAPASQVNFTSLNAADKAREAVSPLLDEAARHLDEYRASKRRG